MTNPVSHDFLLERVVEDSARDFASLAKATGAELLVVFCPHLPLVCRGDASLVKRLFTGLLSMAAFNRHGEVRLELSSVTAGPQSRCEDGRRVRVNIDVASSPSVSGPGVPRQPLDGTVPPGGGDPGRSLESCGELARLMGGGVQVCNDASIRADIVLGVPASQPQVLPFPMPRDSGRKALVIDDNASSRVLTTDLLRQLGLQVWSASSVREAANQMVLGSDPPDVVFLDAELVPGHTCPASLSGDLALAPGIPVVIMDFAEAAEDGDVPGSPCPSTARLLKPVTRGRLYKALETAFGSCAHGAGPGLDTSGVDMSPFSGLRALVVDDSEFNLEVFESILTMAGIRVVTVGNGPDALAILERDPDFAFVLMDMQMPGMDGCETTRRIRGNPDLKSTPILALTANTAPGARQECLASGMNDFLAKPVDTPAMFRALADLLRRRPLTRK